MSGFKDIVSNSLKADTPKGGSMFFKGAISKMLLSAFVTIDGEIDDYTEAIEYVGEIIHEKKHLDPADKKEAIPKKVQEYLKRNSLENFKPLVLEDLEKKEKFFSLWEMHHHMSSPWFTLAYAQEDGMAEGTHLIEKGYTYYMAYDLAVALYKGEMPEDTAAKIGADNCKTLLANYEKYLTLANNVECFLARVTRFEELHRDLRHFFDELEAARSRLMELKKAVIDALELEQYHWRYGADDCGIALYDAYGLVDDYIVYSLRDQKAVQWDSDMKIYLTDSYANMTCEVEASMDLDAAISFLNLIVK